MKKIPIFCFLFLLSLGMKAQTSDEISMIQSLWGMEKRAIVEEYMPLTPVEEPAFWTEYEAYEKARKELGKEKILIISEYVDNYGSLTDEKATQLMNRAIANNIALQKLLQKTFKSMSKVVSPVKAAQFIQLENYFMVTLQMEIQDGLPFIGELEDKIEK
jgi:hypothetical protein